METLIEAVTPVAQHDMSMFALFMQADWVIKSVMLGLLFASVACWAVIFGKSAAYAKARGEMKAFDKVFASGEPLTQVYSRLKDGPLGPRGPRPRGNGCRWARIESSACLLRRRVLPRR